MEEFTLVDQEALLFEKASGCILHRDPKLGKVKFLPLGRWRGTLTVDDMPVKYIALSDHLDMVGVQLQATHVQTRKANGELIQDRVKTTINPWKGGKFMPLTQRGHSVNNYCLSKIWFKSASIDLRVTDITKITSQIKCLPLRWACLPSLFHAKIQQYCGPNGPMTSILYGIWIKQSSAMIFIFNLDKVLLKKLFPTMNI